MIDDTSVDRVIEDIDEVKVKVEVDREGMMDSTGGSTEGLVEGTGARCGRLDPTGTAWEAAIPARSSKESRSCCSA